MRNHKVYSMSLSEGVHQATWELNHAALSVGGPCKRHGCIVTVPVNPGKAHDFEEHEIFESPCVTVKGVQVVVVQKVAVMNEKQAHSRLDERDSAGVSSDQARPCATCGQIPKFCLAS
jgi:hypothetical protein